MKRLIVVLLAVLAFIVILLYLGYPRKQTNPAPESSSSNILYNSTAITPSSQESSEINAMASKTDIYTVKEYEGKIGVFYNQENVPYQEIDVDVASLPEADQALLKEGITVYSTEKLNSIIEDYES